MAVRKKNGNSGDGPERELAEARAQQAATAEILKVIANSPSDVQPVLEVMAMSAEKLCEAKDVIVLLREGDALRYRVHRGDIGTAVPLGEAKKISRDWSAGRCAADGRQIHVHDILEDPDGFPDGARMGKQAGYRTVLMTPLLRDGVVLGVIGMRRAEVRPFEARQIELINTFADQAVIAIENVRLFNETKEALDRQTATAEILKVISSSPTDVTPVFEAIVQSASQLFGCTTGILMRDGAQVFLKSGRGKDLSQADLAEMQKLYPIPFDPQKNITSSVIEGRRLVEVTDTEALDMPPPMAAVGRAGRFRSVVLVPLQREGAGIGAISLTHPEPGWKLNDKQLAMVRTFADQAVIAIENVRLFNESKSLQEERLSRLKSFFSPQLAELLDAGKGEDLLKTHRREITVQFFDLRGFTAFTGAAEPEEVMELLREFHAALGGLVLEHEGTIERFGGDSVMVFFNDPLPVERPAERAMQSAIAMMHAFDPIAARWRKRGYDLGLGAGIAQGYATLGAIGFEGRRDYAAIGPVTNLAARLCAEAKGGQILADSKTVAALEGVFAFDALEPLRLKGFPQPMPAFALRIGAKMRA
jgi:class 3 adenylate cyclase